MAKSLNFVRFRFVHSLKIWVVYTVLLLIA